MYGFREVDNPIRKRKTNQLFHHGNYCIMTIGAERAFAMTGESPNKYLSRHFSGDWGKLSNKDKVKNQKAIETGDIIMSSYTLNDGTNIWIITDGVVNSNGERNVTTILLPSEY